MRYKHSVFVFVLYYVHVKLCGKRKRQNAIAEQQATVCNRNRSFRSKMEEKPRKGTPKKIYQKT